MNIGITGASGLIGRKITDLALRRGHEVIAFSRSPSRPLPGCTMRAFDGVTPPDLSGCNAVIHLAGESVIGLWTPAKKRRITQSRVLGTRAVAAAIQAMPHSHCPEVLVCGSAIARSVFATKPASTWSIAIISSPRISEQTLSVA